jgi:subtilisin
MIAFGTLYIQQPVVAQSSIQLQNQSQQPTQFSSPQLLQQPSREVLGIETNIPQNKVDLNFTVVPFQHREGGQFIPGRFIIELKAPQTPLSPGAQGQEQTLLHFSRLAESLSSQLRNVTGIQEIAKLPRLGVIIVSTENASQPLVENITTQERGKIVNTTQLIRPEDQSVIKELEQYPEVEAVYPDRTIVTFQQILPSGVDRVDADLTTDSRGGRSGNGMGNVNADVAILDTGVQRDHSDLNVHVCRTAYWYLDSGGGVGYYTESGCNDGNGHGTHVAGTAAASDNNFGVVGAAPGARIWAIKVFNADGESSVSRILAGLDYVAQHSHEIEVVNLSFGCSGCESTGLERAVKLLANSGVIVVTSAGNEAEHVSQHSPAKAGIDFDGVISVAAIADSDGRCGGLGQPLVLYDVIADDSFAGFSAYGADIAAPGVEILSTYKGGDYAIASGTSMAAPHVAGAAAYYMSLFPSLSPAEIEQSLKTMATKRPTLQPTDPPSAALSPCDSNGRGYVIGNVLDHSEPLLSMSLSGEYRGTNGKTYYMVQEGDRLNWVTSYHIGPIGAAIFDGSFEGTFSPFSSWPQFDGDVCRQFRDVTSRCGEISIQMERPTEMFVTLRSLDASWFTTTFWNRE